MSLRISDLLGSKQSNFSFEFFPPKSMISALALGTTIGELKNLNPTFISVTCGAGGSTREGTFDLVSYIQNNLNIPAMAHVTCGGVGRDELKSMLEELKRLGIVNLMALRGDLPKKKSSFDIVKGGLAHASELIELAKESGGFSIGCAGYPEKHPQATSLDEDLDYLKLKVDCGADFIVTQMFFENAFYFDFLEKARRKGISVPILPGIMPITHGKQIKRFVELSSSSIPSETTSRFEALREDAQAMYQLGIDLSTLQCQELLDKGAPGVHFYTLNQSRATLHIYYHLKK